jgi:hypothetical protein
MKFLVISKFYGRDHELYTILGKERAQQVTKINHKSSPKRPSAEKLPIPRSSRHPHVTSSPRRRITILPKAETPHIQILNGNVETLMKQILQQSNLHLKKS